MLHIEFLVEDVSGKKALEAIIPNLGSDLTYKIISYKGIGRIPKGMKPGSDANKRILLDQIPRLMQGYASSFKDDPKEYNRWVFVVCDLDDRSKEEFLEEINQSIKLCHRIPNYKVCLAVEEGEAWLLGDQKAVISAYPRAIRAVLSNYVQDSICGTWEKLADAVYPGGSKTLKKFSFSEIGRQKSIWATTIGPRIDKNRNASDSFKHFVKAISDAASRV